MNFNMAMCYMQQNNYKEAMTVLDKALERDKFLAVAYFVRANCFYYSGDYTNSALDYSAVVDLLRSGDWIDYTQLGFLFQLHRCEVLFNRALAALGLSLIDKALEDLSFATRCKAEESHSIVDKAYQQLQSRNNSTKGFTLFIVPPALFMPPKISNDPINPALFKGAKERDFSDIPLSSQIPRISPISNTTSDSNESVSKGKEIASRERDNNDRQAPIQINNNPKQQRVEEKSRQPTTRTRAETTPLPPLQKKELPKPPPPKALPAVPFKPRGGSLGSAAGKQMAAKLNAESTSTGPGLSASIRVKCRYGNDTRLLEITNNITFDELQRKVFEKFGNNTLQLQYKDEDGDLVKMVSQGDLNLALKISTVKIDLYLV